MTRGSYPLRRFVYIGEPILTRGGYGVNITGGHTAPEHPDTIYVWDPDFGDIPWCDVQDAEAEGFVEEGEDGRD